MEDEEYRFENWTLRPVRRELLHAGAPVMLEPRVFDLLSFLVRHHHRAVTKEELLDGVWPGEEVSVGVIARAVMKARKALGDDDREGRLLRTIPRVGYRFAAPVSSARADAAAAPTTPSIALLPFENRTGRAEYDWVELGLLTLTTKALGCDPRLGVASVSSVLLALDRLPAGGTPAARAEALKPLLGVQQVVYAAVRMAGSTFAAEVDLFGDGSPSHHTLLGADLPALGRQVADLLEQRLLHDQARPLPAACPVLDPFASRALLRGLQAAAEQQWQQAANLFRVVLDAEPQAQEVELEYLRALAPLGDERAFPLGERMLAAAHAAADLTRATEVRQALGRAWLNRGLPVPAGEQLDAALRLSGDAHPRESHTLTLLLRSSVAVWQRDFARALDLLLQARRLCDAQGHLHHRTWADVSLAVVHARVGDPQAGYQALRAALAPAPAPSGHDRLVRDQAATLELQARLALRLGLLDEAEACASAALADAEASGAWATLARAAETLCLLGQLTGQREPGCVAAAALGRHTPFGLPGADADAEMARGHQAWAEGRLQDAQAAMARAVAQHEQAQAWLQAHDTVPWLVMLCLQAGQSAEAGHWLRRAEAFPLLPTDAELRAALAWLRIRRRQAASRDSVPLQAAQDIADQAPASLWGGLIALDLAQRLADAGQPEAAAHRLQFHVRWTRALPQGRRLAERLGLALA